MASLDGRNPISSIKGIGTTDNTLFLLSDRFASLNFDGFIPRDNTLIYASDLTIGQTIFTSDPTARDNSFFITRIDTEAVTVEGIQETRYSLYFLGQNDLEEKYTYGAENGNGSFSQNHLFNVYKDDISDVVLGNNGWMITNQGNAIFSNVFVRGTVEATSGKIDGILKVGESKNGDPLVTLGKNIFDSTSFEGSSSEHSGLFLNKHNYLMGYDVPTDVYVTSIVATNNTQNNILRKATFTLNGHTLAVNDLVSITGFTEDKFIELDNVFPVKEITANTFTIYYKNDIAGTTNPITASLKAQSFALNNIYAVTSFSLSQVTTAEETSSVKLYFNNNYTGLFVAGQIIDLSSVLNSSLNINGQYQIISVTEVAGESNDFLTIQTPRVVAGTYTTDLGEITLYETNYKFKVGDDDNSMSYNSYTGALTVTGTINASSGSFTNSVTVGKPNLSYSVSNKQLTTNQATLSTSDVHSFVVGDSVTVSGVDATFNGTYTITAVPTGKTFIYAKTAGNVASTAVSPVGTVSRGIANEGTIFVGYGTSQITINGTGDPLTSAIYAGVGTYGNANTGFFMDASGRFSLKDKLTFTGGNLSITGDVTATSGSFGTFDIGTSGVSGINNWEAVVTNKQLLSNQATLTTLFPHLFIAGDNVKISGVGAPFDGQYIINNILTPTTFTYSKTATDVASSPVNPNGRAVIEKVLISLAAKSDPIVGYPGLYVHNYDDTYPNPIYKSSSGINEYGLWFNNKNSVSATNISQLNNFGISIELGYGYDNFLLTSAAYVSATSATFTYSSSDHLVVIGQDVTIEGVTGGNYNQSVNVSAVSMVTYGTTYRFTATGANFTNFAGTGGSFSRTTYGDFTIFGKGEELASIDVSDGIGSSIFNLFGGVVKVNSASGSFGSTPGTVGIRESLFVNYNDEYGVKIIANSSNGVHFVPYYGGEKSSSLFYYDGDNNRWRFQPPVYMNSNLTVAGTATISSNLAVAGTATISSNLAVNGTATISSNLTVAGTATIRSNLDIDGNARFTADVNSTSNFLFETSNGTDILRLNGTSNILAMGGSTRGTYTVEVLGSVGYTGSLVDTSSKLVKKNIEVYEVSENILNIPAVTFQYDETKTQVGDQELNKTMIGLIAEDFIDQGMPEVVEYDTDGITVRGLDYSKITALLIPVIKTQKERIDSLENRLAALES